MNASEFEKHDVHEATHWWFEGRRRVIRSVLKQHLLPRSGRRVLDVGCGTGGMFELLREFGSVEGVEMSGDARARAARKYPNETVHAGGLPDGLPPGQWDTITLFDVLEHVDQPVEAVRAIREHLVFDGQLIVTVPAFSFLWSQHDELNQHKRRYGRTELVSHLTSGGFRVTYVSYFNSLLFPAVASARLLERLMPHRFGAGTDSDLNDTKEPFNTVLKTVFGAEKWLLKASPLPIGVSLIAVAQRA